MPLVLTADDLELLRRVFRHRFLRATDVYRLFPGRSSDKLSRRLMRLYRTGFLDRPPSQIDRFRPGGSNALVYGLGARGARQLSEALGFELGASDWQARNRTYTRENLDHTLATAAFLVDLELACAAQADVDLLHLDDLRTPSAVSAHQVGWSVDVSWHGLLGTVRVVPDAVIGLRATASDGSPRRSFLFVEIDRGTMTIVPAPHVRGREAFLYRATILRKLLTYAESYRQELHRHVLGLPNARVLFLTIGSKRADAMRAAADRFIVGGNGVPPSLFLFGVHEAGQDPLLQTYLDGSGRKVSLVPRAAPEA